MISVALLLSPGLRLALPEDGHVAELITKDREFGNVYPTIPTYKRRDFEDDTGGRNNGPGPFVDCKSDAIISKPLMPSPGKRCRYGDYIGEAEVDCR